MIGRFARHDSAAKLGLGKVLRVATAGALLVAATTVQFATGLPHGLVIVLSLASLALTGLPVIWGAIQGLARLKSNVDELVSIAIVASMLLGEWISAAVVAWIMVVGAMIEECTSQRARRHIEALLAGSPRGALRIDDDGRIREVSVDELRAGHRILARPGDVIAADGVVEEGESQVDESALTGESVPAAKLSGDRVSAGTVNGGGSLKIRVERVGVESTQGKIIQIIGEAEKHRAPVLRAAESYAKWFTPTILALAGIVWAWSGQPLRAVTVLIVGCPCAFVLATPTAIVAALGRASKHGILVKGGKYLEACSQVRVLAFDKTGTLTTGRCRVVEVVSLDGHARDELLRHAARLEAGAEHPLARAVVESARQSGSDRVDAASIRREAGFGVWEIGGDESPRWRLGNRRLMARIGADIPDSAEAASAGLLERGYTVLYLAEGNRLRGLLAVEEEIRAEAPPVLENLRRDGFDDLYLLTGDVETTAKRVGQRCGIPAGRVQAELLPDQKHRFIEHLELAGQRVGYVGDGTNDGPALARASVGISIGSRENTVALETADVVLMRDGLAGLPLLFRLSRATTRTIRQNLALFGLAFNGSMLALSAYGLLTPILGAIGHNLGSMAVVLNSARLLAFKVPSRVPINPT